MEARLQLEVEESNSKILELQQENKNNQTHKKSQDLFARFLKSLKQVVNYEGHLEENKFTDAQLGDLSEHISTISKS